MTNTLTMSMYQASVPTYTHMLSNLSAILNKAGAYVEAKKIDPAVLIGSRLYPDMLPLGRQVQIAGDGAKGSAARLAGLEAPKYEDDEKTFPELCERLQKTINFLQTFTPDQIDGSENRTITLMRGSQSTTFLGLPYLLHHALPNFYFHVTTAYNILRHNGLEIGKRDFLGKA